MTDSAAEIAQLRVEDRPDASASATNGMAANLSASDRLELIQARVAQSGHVTVRDLAQWTGASEATIRRDLKQLADRQKLSLVYGGATALRTGDHSLAIRGQRNMEGKRVIGDLAGNLVADHDMVFIDSGTTCFEMRHALRQRKGLTAIVNSTRVAIEIGENPDTNVILLAGHYRPERMDTVGPLALNAIDNLRGYVAFIGADGLSQDFGISANEMQTAHLYQHVIRNSRETILLADHSKFGAPSLFRIGDFDSVTQVVTDRDPGPDWRDYLSQHGIRLVTPSAP